MKSGILSTPNSMEYSLDGEPISYKAPVILGELLSLYTYLQAFRAIISTTQLDPNVTKVSKSPYLITHINPQSFHLFLLDTIHDR